MQKSKLLQVVIRLLIISIVFVQACQKTTPPKDTSDIFHALISSSNNKVLFSIEMADSLNKEFEIPLVIDHFKNDPYFSSDYRYKLDSLITESDIYSWNTKIEEYKGRVFDLKHIEGLPIYVPESNKILNSDLILSEFDFFARASIPFMNDIDNKALIFIEYYPNPQANYGKNSFLIIMKKEDGYWREVYRKLLAVSTIN